MSDSRFLVVPLRAGSMQFQHLQSLQGRFAQACNLVAPVVRETHCWNRVALHHLVYRSIREKFPELGSQMACNVIHSVSRMARLIYQHPSSPWVEALKGDPSKVALPLLRFNPDAPVYFDRHTMSLRGEKISLFTLDGRLHFGVGLQPMSLERFQKEKLKEALLQRHQGSYFLRFEFAAAESPAQEGDLSLDGDEIPKYVQVLTQETRQPLSHKMS